MHYKVTSKKLTEQLDEWSARRLEAEAAFLRLSRKCGASRNRFAESRGFGVRVFAFVFNEEPDRKLWKERNGFWLPMVSRKEGKEIAQQIKEIQDNDANVRDIGDMIGLSIFQNPGVRKIGDTYYLSVADDWTIKTKGLRRIADTTIERLEREELAAKKKIASN